MRLLCPIYLDDEVLRSVVPERAALFLREAGWQEAPHTLEAARWTYTSSWDDETTELLQPLDPDAADYVDNVARMLAHVSDVIGGSVTDLLEELARPPLTAVTDGHPNRDIAEQIAQRTGCTPAQVYAVAELVLQSLHELAVKSDDGVGRILDASNWLFGPTVCCHLNSILYLYTWERCPESPDQPGMIHETMLRFLPQEWKRIGIIAERWWEERTDHRKQIDESTREMRREILDGIH